MYADTEMKYRPQQLNRFVFPNSEVEEVINAYASGKATRPLLLSGKNGTGKSLLASLLPHAIEGFEAQINCVRACDLNSNKEVQAKFASNKNFDRLFTINGQTRNYNVIEEVNFDPRARDAFRVVLDEYRGTDLTILTTNELAKIDVGIRSRCEVLEVPPCEPRLFLKRAKEILVAEGCDIDDGDLLSTLEATYDLLPDNRQYYKKLDELLRSVTQLSVD